MDKFGQGVEFQITRLERNRELDLNGFTKQMLLEMCILSGCDYLPSLPGMGVKRAHALIQKLKSYEKVNPVFSVSIEHLSILLHYFMKKKETKCGMAVLQDKGRTHYAHAE
jgi:5'-3' exonuclease